MQLIDHPSPNHGPRADGAAIDLLILHYTGMASGEAALARLCDPAAEVSAHYLIDEDGRVFRLVPEQRRAWHAGSAYWAGERDVNSRSIGIELVNPGHELGYRPFPDAQMAALEALTLDILARHPIPAHRVLGHSDVAPARKRDPGELFDWERLAEAGVGAWPRGVARRHRVTRSFGRDDHDEAIAEVQDGLRRYGYEVEPSGRLDAATELVLFAFQRHFRPWRVDGRLDGESAARLRALLAQRIDLR